MQMNNKNTLQQGIVATPLSFNRNLVMLRALIFCIAVSLAFIACSPTAPVVKGGLSGRLLNVCQLPVRNAAITITNLGTQGQSVLNTQTNNNGEYFFNDLDSGNYRVYYYRGGYIDTAFTVRIANSLQSRIDTLFGWATITGRVNDFSVNRLVSGATVEFFYNYDTSSANAVLRTTTDNLGSFQINRAPIGDFVLVPRKSGYLPTATGNVRIVSGASATPTLSLIGLPPPGALRIILTWGSSPSDLDAHFTGPLTGSTQRFHCYFGNRSPTNSQTNLDLDDVSSFGPETITTTLSAEGMYRFSVHNYSNDGINGAREIGQSPTRVQVYDNSGLVRQYVAPVTTLNGNVWRVFEVRLSGSTRTFTDVNTYVTAVSAADVNIFRIQPSSAESTVSAKKALVSSQF